MALVGAAAITAGLVEWQREMRKSNAYCCLNPEHSGRKAKAPSADISEMKQNTAEDGPLDDRSDSADALWLPTSWSTASTDPTSAPT